MPDLGPHAAFIWAAYAVTALALAALGLFIIADDRRQRRLLLDFERQGITRRSARPTVAVKSELTKSQTAKRQEMKSPKTQAASPAKRPRKAKS